MSILRKEVVFLNHSRIHILKHKFIIRIIYLKSDLNPLKVKSGPCWNRVCLYYFHTASITLNGTKSSNESCHSLSYYFNTLLYSFSKQSQKKNPIVITSTQTSQILITFLSSCEQTKRYLCMIQTYHDHRSSLLLVSQYFRCAIPPSKTYDNDFQNRKVSWFQKKKMRREDLFQGWEMFNFLKYNDKANNKIRLRFLTLLKK